VQGLDNGQGGWAVEGAAVQDDNPANGPGFRFAKVPPECRRAYVVPAMGRESTSRNRLPLVSIRFATFPCSAGTLPTAEPLAHERNGYGRPSMRTVVLAIAAATIAMSVPLASSVKAEDTTVIKKDRDGDTTVIKKEHELHVLPVPHTEEKKTIIRKDHDEE
jgi:hypothetical protein